MSPPFECVSSNLPLLSRLFDGGTSTQGSTEQSILHFVDDSRLMQLSVQKNDVVDVFVCTIACAFLVFGRLFFGTCHILQT